VTTLDSGLRRLLTRPEPAAAPDPPDGGVPACELCAAPLDDSHRHLVDLPERALNCACRPCALLFDSDASGRYRLVPQRRRHLPEFALDDTAWDSLRIPVQVAFFFHDSAAGRTVAFYPSPAGAVESTLDLATWAGIEAANPVLAALAPDVEAVLVHRAGDEPGAWLVPIDDCYALVGLIRSHWTGLAGGARVWEEIRGFFAGLRAGTDEGE
jgi:hypothetical protein